MRIIPATAFAVLTLLACGPAGAAITTDTVRQKAEQACYDDVNRICADAIPDEDRIAACMKQHRSQLNPRCRSIFDANTR